MGKYKGLYCVDCEAFYTAKDLIKVEDITTGEEYPIGKWDILGKLVKVIRFDSVEWKEMFPHCGDNRKWLKETIKDHIEIIKNSDLKDKDEIVKELENRLSKITK